VNAQALKRFGKPEEIAELLAFCASPKAGYLTGTDLLCDGVVVAGRMSRALTGGRRPLCPA
jgi:NAD(P)-dependent dehydrogenase (short-subunit alcohol dehydrogenase family)